MTEVVAISVPPHPVNEVRVVVQVSWNSGSPPIRMCSIPH